MPSIYLRLYRNCVFHGVEKRAEEFRPVTVQVVVFFNFGPSL